jgi:hypothetical protein
MSGLDLLAVHQALATQISTHIATQVDEETDVAGAGGFSVNAFPSTSPRPAIEVWPDTDYILYHETSGTEGLSDLNLMIRIWLSGANEESEWRTVCAFLSGGTGHTSSIHDAVMADRTLDGTVADTFIGVAQWNPEDGTLDIPVEIMLNNQGGQV